MDVCHGMIYNVGRNPCAKYSLELLPFRKHLSRNTPSDLNNDVYYVNHACCQQSSFCQQLIYCMHMYIKLILNPSNKYCITQLRSTQIWHKYDSTGKLHDVQVRRSRNLVQVHTYMYCKCRPCPSY